VTKVLVVDDEPTMLRILRIELRGHGYEVITANGGHKAIEVSARSRPDVVLLDLGLPDMDGLTVIRSIRAWSGVPIIVISGRPETSHKIDALDAGADDYITKPFNIDELLARIRASSRRDLRDISPPVQIGEHTVDLHAHTITKSSTSGDQASESVHLTATEWALLELLVSHPGQLVRQDHLLHAIRGPDAREDKAYLRQFMGQIRRKLEPDPSRPRFLLTELGMGYRFVPGPPPGVEPGHS
jgi:two-component system KDP operon response regulator KdpE